MKYEKILCKKCNCEVTESELKEYTYQCLECDEDLYSFEVYKINTFGLIQNNDGSWEIDNSLI